MVVKNKNHQILTIGIYLRKSRAENGVQDLEKHKDYLIDICNKNGWAYRLYEEVDSSQKLDRAELQRLRKDIELGLVDAVMVNNVDRLSRKARHFLEIIEDYFLEQGMSRLFIRDVENNLSDNTTITMLQLQATLSQAEYSFIVKRLNEGRKSSAKKGIWSGKLVYGYAYNKDKKIIEPVSHEAKVVREIADLLLIGDTYGGVCDKINHFGHRTKKGNLFDVHNIKAIIHSPMIRGHVEVDWKDGEKTLKENSHKAIINDAEYFKIKEILQNRADNYNSLSTAPKHYLQGILKCPKCKKVMSISASKKSKYENGERKYIEGSDTYYLRTCRKYIKNQEKVTCGNFGCQAEIIEEIIESNIKHFSFQLEKDIEELIQVNGEDVKRSNKETVEKYKKAIKEIEGQEVSLIQLKISNNSLPEEAFNNMANELKNKKADLKLKLEEAENKFSAMDIEEELKQKRQLIKSIANWRKLTDEKKRQLIQILFKEITYEKWDKKGKIKVMLIPNE